MGLHAVIETPDFLADADDALLAAADRTMIVNQPFRKKPADGVMIKGTGGARKVRFGGRGKGKSGGYRVISYLSKAECNALAKVLERIAETYRQGVQTYVEGR